MLKIPWEYGYCTGVKEIRLEGRALVPHSASEGNPGEFSVNENLYIYKEMEVKAAIAERALAEFGPIPLQIKSEDCEKKTIKLEIKNS